MKSSYSNFGVRKFAIVIGLGFSGLPCQVEAAYTAGSGANDTINKNLQLNDATNNNLTANGWGLFKGGVQFGANKNVFLNFVSGGSSTGTVSFDTTKTLGTFSWGHAYDDSDGSVTEKMKLDGSNVLTLYNTSGAGITLNPTLGQINLTGTSSGLYSGGTAVFNLNSGGNVIFANRPVNLSSISASTSSTTGALTVAGGLGVASDSYINNIRIGEGGGSFASNTALGTSALNGNTSGLSNTAAGYFAMSNNISGSNSTAFGRSALGLTTFGANDVAIGYWALGNNTTGGFNTALGQSAGRKVANGDALTDPENSIYIGANSTALSNEDNYSIVIGTAAIGEGANTTVIGSLNTTKTHLYGQTVSDSLSVTGNTVLNGGTVVNGNTTFNGNAVLAAPQGDISMGIYGN